MKKFRRARKPSAPVVTIADRFLVAGQRLRVSETATALTVRLPFTAKFVQATVSR